MEKEKVIRKPPLPGRDSLARREIVKKMKDKYLKDVDIDNKTIALIVDAFLETYKEAIVENKRIEIRNFGVINSELIKGRLITHPETKEQSIAAPYYRLSFKPSAAFKKLLRERAKQEVLQS